MSPRTSKDSLLIKVLFVFLILLLPTQLAYHFWPSWSFIFGIRIDYFSPTLYLTDIFVVALLGVWLVKDRSVFKLILKFKKETLIVLAYVFINIFFSYRSSLSLYKWVKILEMVLLGAFVVSYKALNFKKHFLKPLILSSLPFSLIGIVQFVKGSTIGFPLSYLGERSFNLSTPGIALVKIFGQDYLRAYSTFPHPNAFAGFLGIVLIFLYYSKSEINKYLYLAIGLVTLISFILTFSLASFVAFLLLALVYYLQTKRKIFKNLSVVFMAVVLVSFSLLMFSKVSFSDMNLPKDISERIYLINISRKLFLSRPLIGVGLGAFIVGLNNLKIGVASWLLQPVHNIFLLVVGETGLIGLLGFIFIFLKSFLSKNGKFISYALLFIVLTGAVDHYWLTLQQNLLLMTFVLGFALRKKQKVLW